jgi:hypothetical protein
MLKNIASTSKCQSKTQFSTRCRKFFRGQNLPPPSPAPGVETGVPCDRRLTDCHIVSARPPVFRIRRSGITGLGRKNTFVEKCTIKNIFGQVFGVRKALVGYKLFFEEDQNPPSPTDRRLSLAIQKIHSDLA